MVEIIDGQILLSPKAASLLDFIRDCADDFEYLFLFSEEEEAVIEEFELLGLL